MAESLDSEPRPIEVISWDMSPMTDEEYGNLPPLVRSGEDREAVIERIVAGWCGSAVSLDGGKQLIKGGFLLERVALTDGNNGEPIDLGELIRRVDECLRKNGEPDEFRPSQNGCIYMKGCRVDQCNCSGLMIRPPLIASHVKFGNETCFHSSVFSGTANFTHSTFGPGANFQSTRFGDFARFDSAIFGSHATFENAAFGVWARFDHAVFGSQARFDSSKFGIAANFEAAIFDAEASFSSTLFGMGVSFLNTRFGPCGGIGAANPTLRQSPIWKQRLRQYYRWFLEKRWWFCWIVVPLWLANLLYRLKQKFDWVVVQGIGRLQVLTRVSYLALIIVPILAGTWRAVQIGIHQYHESLAAAAQDFDRSAERLRNALTTAPLSTSATSGEAAKTIERLQQRAENWRAIYGTGQPKPRMPVGWALAFLAALCVTLGHFIYQTASPDLIREKTNNAFRAERVAAFITSSKKQFRDQLIGTFPCIYQLALKLPRQYHPNLVRRHGQTIWIPNSLDQLDKVVEASHSQSVKSAINEPPGEYSEPSPKFTKRELELILIDEGARADYIFRAHENIEWAYIAGVSYFAAGVLISRLIYIQCHVVLEAVGWLP